jgi:hypothetical protein
MSGTFVQEGLEILLKAALRGQSPPASLYMALVTDASVAANATWASLTEVSGTGYARVAVTLDGTGFPTAANVSTNGYHIKTKDCVFTAGGTWTTAKCCVLLTTNDGSPKIIAWGSVGGAGGRTLVNSGDTETVNLDLPLTEA